MGPGPVLHIRDVIDQCADRNVRARQPGKLNRVLIHRISLDGIGLPDNELDGPMMAEAFRSLDMGTGGEVPYTFLVQAPEGVIDQCLPLKEVGPHARIWNQNGIGVAIVGDFRKHAPDPRQWHNTMGLCAALMAWGLELYGHTELPNSTRYKNHICPGRLWPIQAFRAEVRALSNKVGSPADANALLARAGVIYGD